MPRNGNKQAPLRLRAEEILEADGVPPEEKLADALEQIIHELQVHQIELELQNEELRNTRNDLEESRLRYMDLYHNAPVGYVVLDGTGTIREANATFAEMVRRDRANILDKPFGEFILPADRGIFFARAKTFFKNPQGKNFELRIHTGTSAPCHVSLKGTLFVRRTSKQEQSGKNELLLTITDITDLKRLEQDNLLLQKQLTSKEKEESLGRMAGAIAHHYNNLLFVILGNIELAMGQASYDELLTQSLMQAMEGTNRAAEISSRMLTYLGLNTKNKIEIDLGQFCRQRLPFALNNNAELSEIYTDFPEQGPLIMANACQIEEILAILLENARESRQDGASIIKLAVSTVRAREISTTHRFPVAWSSPEMDFACLQISDNGCGIDDEHLGRIFDPFFSDKLTGRGMGLPLALGIIRAHKGCVTVESRPGQGTTFNIYLPLINRNQTAPTPR